MSLAASVFVVAVAFFYLFQLDPQLQISVMKVCTHTRQNEQDRIPGVGQTRGWIIPFSYSLPLHPEGASSALWGLGRNEN